jgi:hypothetical protein
MKKLIAMLLVLTTVLCICASCKSNKNETVDSSDSDSSESAYTWPSNLDYSGYDGYDFRILTWGSNGGQHWSAYEFIYDESLTGDVVNDAVNERDKKLEEKLNISISYIEKPQADIKEFARTSIQAGGDDFDLVSVSISSASSLAQEGDFLDLYDYTDILNLDADYWDQGASEQLSIGNHLYFTVSDLTLTDKQATWVVFFMPGLLSQYPSLTEGYENGLFSMVEQGEWTIEKMYNMVKTVSHDTGDGEMTDADYYGHCGEVFNLAALMVGCGSLVAEKDSDDIPQYVWTDNIDSLVNSYSYVYEIVENSDYSMLSGKMQQYGYSDVWVDGFGTMMNDERVLFNVTGMNRCKLYRDMESDFCIVPVPKADESQENYRMLMSYGYANCVAIPVTCQDVERTCTILEAMTSLASQTTYSAYIDKALGTKYLRDEDSREMLSIIFDNRVYDPVDIYGWGTGTQGLFTGAPSVTAVSSSIQAVKKYTQNSIKKGVQKFEKVYEKNGENN